MVQYLDPGHISESISPRYRKDIVRRSGNIRIRQLTGMRLAASSEPKHSEHHKTWRNNEKQCTPFPEHSKSTFALHLGPCLPKTFLLRRSRKSFQQWLTFTWQTWPPKQIIARRCMFLHFKKICQSPASFPTSKFLLQSLSESIPFLTQTTEPNHVCPWGDNPIVVAAGTICPHPKTSETAQDPDRHFGFAPESWTAGPCLHGNIISHQQEQPWNEGIHGMPMYAPFGDKTTTQGSGDFSFTFGHSLPDSTGFWVEWFRSLLVLYIIWQFWGTPNFGPAMTHLHTRFGELYSPNPLWNGWFQPFPLSKIPRKLLNPIDFFSNPIETVFLLRNIPRKYHDTSIPP